ncbi:MAG: family of carbohydrate kinase, N-terminal domain, partial [Actinomycetota bacterium]
MADVRCILALDQGTSSTKGVLFGLDSVVRGVASVPVDLHSPAAGWVQQDPEQ